MLNMAKLKRGSELTKIFLKDLTTKLIPMLLLGSSALAAETNQFDAALERYYAGFPDEAISIIKPMALSGNADAQYLLGNIFYSLSKTTKLNDTSEAVIWYQKAAKQNSAAANYALGVIFQGRWRVSRDIYDAAFAIVYFQEAFDLGSKKAQSPLTRIKSRSGLSQQQAAVLVASEITVSSLKPESRTQSTRKELTNLQNDELQTSIDMPTTDNAASTKNKSPVEPKPTAEKPKQTVQTSGQTDDRVKLTVSLDYMAGQCQNYTEAGFELYAETIKGLYFSGQALIDGIKPDSSKPDAYSIYLTNNLFGVSVFLDLGAVPKEVAARYKEGDKFEATGIIIESRLVDPNCAVSLRYQPARG